MSRLYFRSPPISRTLLIAAATASLLFFSTTAFAQTGSRANSQQIDPIRVGDDVEVMKFRTWYPGAVLSYADGVAEVEYEYHKKQETKEFSLSEIRFPNGEGEWRVWKAPKRDIKVEARYITRDKDNVMIRDGEGEEYEIAIEDLSIQLKQLMKKIPIPGDENKVNGVEPFRVGDEVQVEKYSRWYEGVVMKMTDGKIEVEYDHSGTPKVERFEFDEIKYPNGEGYWQMWKDTSGKFAILARYRSRTKTHVKLITETGKEIEVPIDKLALKLRKGLRKVPVTGSENLVNGVAPLRVGDLVEFKDGSYWQNGTVTEMIKGQAMIAYTSDEKDYSKAVDLEDITFANGQGPWMTWEDESKKFSVIARYTNRTDSKVTLLTEANKEVSLDIERLSPKLRTTVKQSVSWTPLPEKVTFARSPKKVNFMSSAADFSALALDSSSLSESTSTKALADGGFGFPLNNGNQISTVKPTGVDGWIMVGTYSDGKLDKYPITRLHWADPAKGKVAIGPGFSGDQRVIDYSAKQGRLLTAIMSGGYNSTALALCTYRVTPGGANATPEHRWDLPESKNRYGADKFYKARLVNDQQLLLARDSNLTLYDFENSSTVFELSGLDNNSFQLHPSGNYVLVRQKDKSLSLHETSSGRQIGADSSGKFYSSGFSQDGTQIVGVSSKSVFIWDITRNASVEKFKSNNLSSTSSTFSSAELLDKQWVWMGGRLYNTAKQMLVWNYAGGSSSNYRESFKVRRKSLVGDRILVAATLGDRYGKTAPMALIGIAKVPHKAAIDQMNAVDAESMLMLKPGIGVRIETEGDPRVRKGVERAITANGWTEDPNSKIVVTASAKLGERQTQQYEQVTYQTGRFGGRMHNPFRRPDPKNVFSISYTPWIQKVNIAYDGKMFSSQARSGYAPGSARDRAELNKAVQAAGKPDYSLFENLAFPETMVYPQYQNGLGYSSISREGFKDVVKPLPDAEKKEEEVK